MEEEKALYAYIDESGILSDKNNKSHKYFIISIVLTDNPHYLGRIFKRSRLKEIKKHTDLQKILYTNKELKGSEITEKQKEKIYSEILQKCSIEFGIIMIDTMSIDTKYIQNTARTFNYLLKLFFSKYKKSDGKFVKCDIAKLFIDERNVETKSKHTLREYLNTALILDEGLFTKDFEVSYCDSRDILLIQLSDYIANTTYRSFHATNQSRIDALNNIELLRCNIIGKKFLELH